MLSDTALTDSSAGSPFRVSSSAIADFTHQADKDTDPSGRGGKHLFHFLLGRWNDFPLLIFDPELREDAGVRTRVLFDVPIPTAQLKNPVMTAQ